MALKNIENYTAGRSRFVLVVDSNARNLQFLTSLLKKFDYDAYAVRTATEAQELAAVVSPVLVVVARQLDGGNDALGLIRDLRGAKPACTAPCIVLTAKADPVYERDCLGAGALTCLRAPISVENFYRVIQVAIEPVPRMTIRISTNLPVIVNGARKDACVQAISEQGAYITTSSLHPLKTKLPVKIKLSEWVICADAEVIYSKSAGDNGKGQSGMGIQFVHISEQDQQRIRLFIRSEMSKGINPLPNAR